MRLIDDIAEGWRRRGPGVYLHVGRWALAQAPPFPEAHYGLPWRRFGGDRQARPRPLDPATGDTAPLRPERSSWESDRPGHHRVPGVRNPRHPVTERAHDAPRRARATRREHGRPAHPTPFRMRAVAGHWFKTHSCTLLRNGPCHARKGFPTAACERLLRVRNYEGVVGVISI